jgi:hypothetical protein
MSPKTTFAVIAVAFSASSLAACSQASDDPAVTKPSEAVSPKVSHVPDGVRAQYEVLAEELDEKGMTTESGEWTINLITEAAEPWHVVESDGSSTFREPADGETNHIEIIPVETATGRIVPDVPVSIDVLDETGASVQKLDLNFYWSTFAHYARNFSIPKAGDYTLKVTVGVPTFPRHGDEDEAPAMSKGATVEFDDVALGTA